MWKPSQVIKLFDSVLRGYPVGSFLSWKVLPETVGKFKFYGFMKDYSGYDKKHNPVVDIPLDREVIAALDGQQRLTSLKIGLRGTYADDFLAFFDARRELLVGRIKDKLRTHSVAVLAAVAAAPTDLDAELGEGDLDD